MKVNMNTEAVVTLTQVGIDMLKRRHDAILLMAPEASLMPVEYNPGDTMELPLWEVANLFGSLISFGGEPPIEINIDIDLPPIDMIIYCPECKNMHIDAETPLICKDCGCHFDKHGEEVDGDGRHACENCEACNEFRPWLNDPHKRHRCAFCNHVFKTANVATNGVRSLPVEES